MQEETTRANALRRNTGAEGRDALLDSSLNLPVKKHLYDLKIIDCGEYIQVYEKEHKFKANEPNNKTKKEKSIKDIDTDNLIRKELLDFEEKKHINSDNEIKQKNANRSKLQCQRLAKTNSDAWNTFITLTFEDNIKDIDIANKKFYMFIDNIKKVFKEFKYICIPEFQKRGAVHYHLLSNIDIDNKLITIQIRNKRKYYHIKYWACGFNKVDRISGDIKKIIGYISKYMTKDIDNRLFGKHRYHFSRNLLRPCVKYIDLNNENDKVLYNSLIKNKELIYENEYISSYDNDNIKFKEYL